MDRASVLHRAGQAIEVIADAILWLLVLFPLLVALLAHSCSPLNDGSLETTGCLFGSIDNGIVGWTNAYALFLSLGGIILVQPIALIAFASSCVLKFLRVRHSSLSLQWLALSTPTLFLAAIFLPSLDFNDALLFLLPLALVTWLLVECYSRYRTGSFNARRLTLLSGTVMAAMALQALQ